MPSEWSLDPHIDDASESPGPPLPTPNRSSIPQQQNLETSYHRLISRATTSSNGPLIIGATVGGISFISILVVAIVLWSRKVNSQKNSLVNDSRRSARRSQMTQSPAMFNEGDDKIAELGYIRRTPNSAAGALRSPSLVSQSKPAPASVVATNQTRRHSLTPLDFQPALKRTSTVLTRATTQRSKISSPSSTGRRSKTSSRRFGSRDLSQPPSLHTVSSSWGPSPHRSPRLGEVGSEDGNSTQPQIFELSAHPSVKRKRYSKPLPMLPTYLVREHEEEMKRRREELEREKSEQFEATRRPQSPAEDLRIVPPQLATPSSTLPGPSGETKARPEQTVLKKVMSLESLASTSSSSGSISDEGEPPSNARVPPAKVNALSPRSSQRRQTKVNTEHLPPIPSISATEAESESAGEDQHVTTPGNKIEPTRTPETLRLPTPLPLLESGNVLDAIQAPISATVPKPHIFSPHPDFQSGSLEAHRTQGTTAGDIVVSGEKFMLEDNLSERALALSSIQDWRESVGQTYASTRPPTAGSVSAGRSSPDDIPALPAVVDIPILPLQPRPPLPGRISVDTGVGNLHSPPPTLVAVGGTFLTATSTATSSATSTPLEEVPVSAVTPGSNVIREQLVLQPSTPEMEQESIKTERQNTPSGINEVKGPRIGSWLDTGDSDSEG